MRARAARCRARSADARRRYLISSFHARRAEKGAAPSRQVRARAAMKNACHHHHHDRGARTSSIIIAYHHHSIGISAHFARAFTILEIDIDFHIDIIDERKTRKCAVSKHHHFSSAPCVDFHFISSRAAHADISLPCGEKCKSTAAAGESCAARDIIDARRVVCARRARSYARYAQARISAARGERYMLLRHDWRTSGEINRKDDIIIIDINIRHRD